MVSDDGKSLPMQTPRLVPADAPAVTERKEALSTSAIQRALRRASNPCYSGSPTCSEPSTNGVRCMSTNAQAADDEVGNYRFTQTGRALARPPTLLSVTPGTACTLLQAAVEHTPVTDDHAVFRLEGADIAPSESCLPLQGGDMAAASPSCSQYWSSCTDGVAGVARANNDEQQGGDISGWVTLVSEVQPASGHDHSMQGTELHSDLSEFGANGNQQDFRQQQSSACLGACILSHVRSGSVLGAAVCAQECAGAGADLEALPDRLPIEEASLDHEAQPRSEATATAAVLPSSSQSPCVAMTAKYRHRHNSAKDRQMHVAHRTQEECLSESSVSVGSYLGFSPQVSTPDAVGQRDCSQFTFSTMPDAGHGSPQNHCFEQTPAPVLESRSTSVSPNVKRALFTDRSPSVDTASYVHGKRCPHSSREARTWKRIWQAANLILLTTSFAMSMYMLGRGNVTVRQDGITPAFIMPAQRQIEHMLRGQSPYTALSATRAKIAPYIETRLPLPGLRRAREEFKYHVSRMIDAAKRSAFRSSVVLNYRLGSLAPYVSPVSAVVQISTHSRSTSTPVVFEEGAEAVVQAASVQQPDNLSGGTPLVGAGHREVEADVASCGEDAPAHILQSCLLANDAWFDLDVFQQNVCVNFVDHEGLEDVDASAGQFDPPGPDSAETATLTLPSVDVLSGATVLPAFDTARKVNPWKRCWTERLDAMYAVGADMSVSVVNAAFAKVSQMSYAGTVHFCTLRRALIEATSYFMLNTRRALDSSNWHMIQGVDHPLVICTALGLFMSVISMLMYLAQFWHVLERHHNVDIPADSDSGTDYVSARQPQPRKLPSTTRDEMWSTDDNGAASFYTAYSHGYSTRFQSRKVGLEYSDTAVSPMTRV